MPETKTVWHSLEANEKHPAASTIETSDGIVNDLMQIEQLTIAWRIEFVDRQRQLLIQIDVRRRCVCVQASRRHGRTVTQTRFFFIS